MTSRYHKGRYYEYKVRNLLKKLGWLVIRAAKSAPIDLVAVRGGETVILEIKKNGPKKVPGKFAKLLSQYKLKGVYITIINNLYWWKPINLDQKLIEEFSKAFGPNRL